MVSNLRLFIFVYFIFLTHFSFSQHIQYASKIVAFSSELGNKQNATQRILGKPDAMPQCGNHPCAWAPKTADGTNEFIQVEFEKPMPVLQVAVFENFNPGTIKSIILFDTDKKPTVIYEGVPGVIGDKCRVLRQMLPALTGFAVQGLKIEMDCSKVPGINQIDAIAISDTSGLIEAKVDVVPNLKFESGAENLGPNINSAYSEVLPVISPDGRTLYVVRKDHPENTDILMEKNDDIWFSTMDDKGNWLPLKNIGYPLNNENHNFVISVTPDGNKLFLGNQYFKDGSSGAGASSSVRVKKGWDFPENLEIEKFYNKAEHVEFQVSGDGKTMLMTTEMDDAIGGRDIYVSFLIEKNKWSKPLNLGPDINTAGDEASPFLASDGRTLYFATNGRSTFGSHDVFFSKRLDSTWQKWSQPLNLGPELNTPDFDAYYRVPASGEYAYFVSANHSLGEQDIFRIKLPKEVQPDPVVLVYGTVYNKKTNKPVGDANIKYEILPGGQEVGIARSEPGTGAYKIVLPYGKNYGFLALAKDFISVSDNLDLTEIAQYKEIKKDLYLAPIEVGEVVRLNNIFFDFDKATLRSESFPELDRVVNFLKENQKIEIELSGHTDSKGSDTYNQTLSQNRAKAVVDYIIGKGIEASRLIAKGYGESKPVATNDTEEGRQLNRRVEFEILKK